MLDSVKEHASNVFQWAVSGSKLTYAALGIGLMVGLILFRFFFRSPAGLFHSIGFSFGSGGNPTVAAEPGLASSSRMKLLLIVILPAAFGYAAYMALPGLFPTVFK